jgi:hypothetical protein
MKDLETLKTNSDWDLAIQYSITNRCTENMQLVLKAYGMRHDQEYATTVLVSLMAQ